MEDKEAHRDRQMGPDNGSVSQGIAPSSQPDHQQLQGVTHPQAQQYDSGMAENRPSDAQSNEELPGELFHYRQQVIQSGPLPSAQEFAGYERTLPGAADRILKMAEAISEADIADQHTSTKAEASAFKVAAYAFALLPYMLLAATLVLAFTNHEIPAIIAAIAAVITTGPQLVTAVRGKKDK